MAESNSEVCECVNKNLPSYRFAIKITEVLARNILRHAGGFKDLRNFSFTCRHYDAQVAHLWKKLLFSAFPGGKITKYMIDNRCYSPIRVYWELLKRSRFVTGMEIGGAWTADTAYYEGGRQTEGSISKHPLYLKTVCWLELVAWFSDVYPGKYEVVWRVKQTSYHSPVLNAEIFYKKGDNDSWGEEVSWEDLPVRSRKGQPMG